MYLAAYRQLAPYVGRLGARVFLLTLSALIGGAAETLALLLTVRVALALAGGGGTISLPFGISMPPLHLIVFALVCGVIALLSHIVIARLGAGLQATVMHRLRETALAAFIHAGWETQSAQREGRLQEAATTLSSRAAAISQNLVTAGTNGVMLVIFVVAALISDPVTSAISVAAGGLIALGLRPVARATNKRSSRAARTGGEFAEDVSRFTSASMELKVFGVQAAAESQLDSTSRTVADNVQGARFTSLVGSTLFRDVAVILLVLCIGALLLIGGDSGPGVFAVITLVVRAMASAQLVNTATQSLNENAPNLDILVERIQEWRAGAERSGGRPVGHFGSMRLEDVEYRYPGGEKGVGPLALEIDHGQSVGVIGKSGSGKSTFVQLLLRLRRPTSGRIFVDDIEYSEFSSESWADAIGFVPQEPSLLEASIYDNIDFERKLPREAIEQAARDAHVAEDIQSLPDGFGTLLGPRGAGLSGGQKQRVAIARALAGRPKLLLLDEPTSALDPRSESLLTETLRSLRGKTTVVVIAHRTKTVRDCDRLVVFENGRIVEDSSPGEMLESDSYFRSMTEHEGD